MDAPDQLFLSRGFCRQLDIVMYHRDMCTHKGKPSAAQTPHRKDQAKVSTVAVDDAGCAPPSPSKCCCANQGKAWRLHEDPTAYW